jgi:hypothetical protein
VLLRLRYDRVLVGDELLQLHLQLLHQLHRGQIGDDHLETRRLQMLWERELQPRVKEPHERVCGVGHCCCGCLFHRHGFYRGGLRYGVEVVDARLHCGRASLLDGAVPMAGVRCVLIHVHHERLHDVVVGVQGWLYIFTFNQMKEKISYQSFLL